MVSYFRLSIKKLLLLFTLFCLIIILKNKDHTRIYILLSIPTMFDLPHVGNQITPLGFLLNIDFNFDYRYY